MKKNIDIFIFIFAILSLFAFMACDKVEDQVPQNSIEPEVALSTRQGASAALNGAYDILQSANYYGTRYLLFPDMMGGNLSHTGTFPSFAQIANRVTLADNVEVTNIWATLYNGINRSNQIIDKVPKINDPAFTNQAATIAEAQFLRAFHYFNLLRYWGGVPLKLKPTDAVLQSELQLPRNSVTEVYQQILADLNAAIPNLPTSGSNFRATRAAAYALLARVNLYRSSTGLANEYQQAIDNAVLASAGRTLAPVFSDLYAARNTNEVIWQVESNSQDQNSIAFFLLPTANGGRNELRPSSGLQAAYAMTDVRRIQTNSTNQALKYFRPSTGDDYAIIFRLAEMLLTRAEALVERNTGSDLTDAITIINQIRTRAGIGNYTGVVTQTALRDEVFLQRRLELALEGHYFFDLVRTGRAASVLTSPPFNSNQAVFPIPLRELQANPNLTQNPGY